MADSMEQTYTTDFNSALDHALQQKRSILIDTFNRSGSRVRGEKKRIIERLEPQEAERITGKHQQSNPRVQTWEQRWITGHRYRNQRLVDKPDRLLRISDPTNPMVQSVRYSLFRAADRQEAIPAFFGPAYAGEDGNTVKTFPTGANDANNVTAGGSTAAHYLAAVTTGLQLLEDEEVDLMEEPVHAVIPPAVKRILFGDVTVTSGDYHPTRGIIESYKLPPMYGVNWIVHTGMKTAVSGNYEVPLYTKMGMQFEEWDELEAIVDRRPDFNHDWQIAGYHWMGAARSDEKRVIRLKLPVPG